MSSSGTQSPPLEATGEHVPMGASSVSGGAVKAVPDSEQRKDYMGGKPESGWTDGASGQGEKGQAKPRQLGESLQDKLDKRT